MWLFVLKSLGLALNSIYDGPPVLFSFDLYSGTQISQTELLHICCISYARYPDPRSIEHSCFVPYPLSLEFLLIRHLSTVSLNFVSDAL
jgi:hypothetical protein